MSKFNIGDRITFDSEYGLGRSTGTVCEIPERYKDDDTLNGPDKVWAMWDGDDRPAYMPVDQVELIDPKPEPVVVPSVYLHNAAQLDRIEALLRFSVNRFYGVILDDDNTFRKVGILPEYSTNGSN